MLRAGRITCMPATLAMLLFVCLCLSASLATSEARWTVRPRPRPQRTTTPRTSRRRTTTITTEAATTTAAQDERLVHHHHWPGVLPTTASLPPARPTPPSSAEPAKLIEHSDQRALDGHYEFRYQLDNGDTRYERAYWLPVGKNWVLARKGYYSVPLPNSKYATTFYTADHQGYRVDQYTLSAAQPVLPRTLHVPDNLAHLSFTVTRSKPNLKPLPKHGYVSIKLILDGILLGRENYVRV
ncbi:uncharacterized protein LOC115627401 [Scaptodrosophila lebanonensis]|uniref:Uncharacterized protein LOC115627401 n=1 Tax=Drosophila lebanonensis TaxID=7225 RepID=A0A6J2TQG4_DROLE|nr:uncharacterized protein LOC115627401 [Scaptodrosophila lebanonensis]